VLGSNGLTIETGVSRDKIRMLRDADMTDDNRRLMLELAELVNKLSKKMNQLSGQQTSDGIINFILVGRIYAHNKLCRRYSMCGVLVWLYPYPLAS